jgi:hypothetical protein
MAQQLQSFTRRMMERTVEAHSTRTEHDRHCCQLAHEYSDRLGTRTAPAPQAAPKLPAPRPAFQAPAADVRPISPAQARYVRGLRRKVALELLSPQHRVWVETVVNGDEIRLTDANDLLEAMISLADRTPSVRRLPEPAYIPEEGPYQIGDDIYLVVTGRETGRRYAKQFNPDSGKFFYLGQRNFDDLTEDRRMTAEQAAAFALLYGKCCNCDKRLTKKVSLEHGYGPVCAEKNGWPY